MPGACNNKDGQWGKAGPLNLSPGLQLICNLSETMRGRMKKSSSALLPGIVLVLEEIAEEGDVAEQRNLSVTFSSGDIDATDDDRSTVFDNNIGLDRGCLDRRIAENGARPVGSS